MEIHITKEPMYVLRVGDGRPTIYVQRVKRLEDLLKGIISEIDIE